MTDNHDDPPQTERLREASPAEDRLIRYLSRMMGQVAMQAWTQLPPEMKEDFSMALTISAALTHNLGLMLASAPKEGIPVDDPAWQQFVETTCEMVRANAIDARRRVLEQQAIRAAGGTTPEAEEAAAPAPRVIVAQPKFLM